MTEKLPRSVILLHAAAPPKPKEGAPCNGCGLCCAAEPCPLGVWLSRRRHGSCAALQWNEALGLYRCGAITDPERWLPWLPSRWAVRLARRWVAAAQACDADLLPA
jgi:hypothetical protein